MAFLLVPPEDRERRLIVIENGIKTEFWKVLCESMSGYCHVKMQEVIDLHGDNKTDEAKRLAIFVEALQRFMKEPTIIIRENKPIF